MIGISIGLNLEVGSLGIFLCSMDSMCVEWIPRCADEIRSARWHEIGVLLEGTLELSADRKRDVRKQNAD